MPVPKRRRAPSSPRMQRATSALAPHQHLDVLVRHTPAGLWTAQGLQLDYVASGTSLQDVIERFECGLILTLRVRSRELGARRAELPPAPAATWRRFENPRGDADHYRVTVRKVRTTVPVQHIRYFYDEPAATR